MVGPELAEGGGRGEDYAQLGLDHAEPDGDDDSVCCAEGGQRAVGRVFGFGGGEGGPR